MIKSLGEGYSLYRKGNGIAVSKGNEEIAEFPIGSGAIDLLVNPYSEPFIEIRDEIKYLKKNMKDINDVEGIIALKCKINEISIRNSNDIRCLKDKIEQLGIMKSGDVYSFDKRLNTLEELLQSGKNVTVHSRLNDMEKEICSLRKLKEDLESVSCSNYFVQQTHKHDVDIAHLERQIKIDEQNICINSRKISDFEMRFQGHDSSPQVSFERVEKLEKSIKAIEERFDRMDKNMNVIDMEWHHMRDGLTGVVRNILKSL